MASSNRRRLRNARQLPQVYYGLHMAPGVAEYEEREGIQRILVTEQVIKEMNPSFRGKPIYVLHQETDLETLHEQLDGTVVKSFYNPTDGMTWCIFTVHTDAAHDAIANGWKLSNSYLITDSAGGGRWHNVPYDEEVLGGIFEHLALVPNPRYEESVIYTPEEFAAYNERKELELRTLQNSKKELQTMGFRMFLKKKVTNADQLAGAMIELEDGTSVPFSKALRRVAADAARKKTNSKRRRLDAADLLGDDEGDGDRAPRARRRANDDGQTVGLEQEITVGDRVMTIRELIQKFLELETRGAENASEDDDEDGKDKKKKENAKRRRAAALAASRSNARDEDLEDEDLEEDEPDLDEDGDPIENSSDDSDPDEVEGEGEGDEDPELEEDDADQPEPRARRNAKQTLRANSKGGKKKPNQRDRRTRENDADEHGGRMIRVSPTELRLLKESRQIHADKLRNARDEARGTDARDDEEEVLDTSIDQLRRGRELYSLPTPEGSKEKH